MMRVYTNWCQGTTSVLMSKATMWKHRQSYVPQLVYSVSILLLKNILVWQNILYFLDDPKINRPKKYFIEELNNCKHSFIVFCDVHV